VLLRAAALTGAPAVGVIIIDGKTLRRSYQNIKARKRGFTWSRSSRATAAAGAAVKLRQIVAIPKRFAVTAIEGVIVTLDAMGCQRGVASKS
jgi:hypothetical protein